MSKFEKFEDIEVWDESYKLALDIYKLTQNGAFSRDWGLKEQIQKSAVSIPSNISEGFERGSKREFIRFLSIAKGSAGELRTQIYLAKDLSYIDEKTFNDLINKVKIISSKISNLIKYLKNYEK